ncbi:MAG: hypothetical protein J7604_04900 [Sporocytophaga sp.]|uniref:hypothetical protein n=1 Tax=Sporocytophaga sp. TaxID=2231183 RepID=UPI001B23A42D|nr:hypothetical protein [Sporocytophaga sp.]MBO9699525.1 hypothetical protein [Sporocytophaga sp.]
MGNENKTYSIAIRLQRITHEDAYLSVPLTKDVTKEKEDGSLGIDFEKLVAEAVKLSQDPKVEWKIETVHLEPHPVQHPKPEDRKSFDPMIDD